MQSHLELMTAELLCPICLGMLGTCGRPERLGCEHVFCRECLLCALDVAKACPLCKEPATKRSMQEDGLLARVVHAAERVRAAFAARPPGLPPLLWAAPSQSELASAGAGGESQAEASAAACATVPGHGSDETQVDETCASTAAAAACRSPAEQVGAAGDTESRSGRAGLSSPAAADSGSGEGVSTRASDVAELLSVHAALADSLRQQEAIRAQLAALQPQLSDGSVALRAEVARALVRGGWRLGGEADGGSGWRPPSTKRPPEPQQRPATPPQEALPAVLSPPPALPSPPAVLSAPAPPPPAAPPPEAQERLVRSQEPHPLGQSPPAAEVQMSARVQTPSSVAAALARGDAVPQPPSQAKTHAAGEATGGGSGPQPASPAVPGPCAHLVASPSSSATAESTPAGAPSEPAPPSPLPHHDYSAGPNCDRGSDHNRDSDHNRNSGCNRDSDYTRDSDNMSATAKGTTPVRTAEAGRPSLSPPAEALPEIGLESSRRCGSGSDCGGGTGDAIAGAARAADSGGGGDGSGVDAAVAAQAAARSLQAVALPYRRRRGPAKARTVAAGGGVAGVAGVAERAAAVAQAPARRSARSSGARVFDFHSQASDPNSQTSVARVSPVAPTAATGGDQSPGAACTSGPTSSGSPPAGASQPPSPLDDRCAVCGSGDSYDDDLIVYCDKCDVAVHEICYAVRRVPEGEWLCDPCAAGLDTAAVGCPACPAHGGALKRTRGGAWGGWSHVVCTMFLPETGFWRPDELVDAAGFDLIPEARRKLKCSLCPAPLKASGAKLQCHHGKCAKAFHPTCALGHGLALELHDGADNRVFCEAHRPGGPRRPAAQPHAGGGAKKRRKSRA